MMTRKEALKHYHKCKKDVAKLPEWGVASYRSALSPTLPTPRKPTMPKSPQARGRASKLKGKVGEREAAKALQEALSLDEGTLRRSAQYCGKAGDADVVGIPGVHIECKRTETFNLYKALQQAKDDCQGNLPVVVHRKNKTPWVLVVEVSNLKKLSNIVSSLSRKPCTKRTPLHADE